MKNVMKFQIILLSSVLLFNSCSSIDTITSKKEEIQDKKEIEITKVEVDSPFSQGLEEKDFQHYTMDNYKVFGKEYFPKFEQVGTTIIGDASWYGPRFHKRLTSNGEIYNMYDYTAAHKTLPMNTMLKVTNQNNGKSVIVRINDRGPFIEDRTIDLSKVAALDLDMVEKGIVPVKIEVLGFADKQKNKIGLQIASFKKIDKALEYQQTLKNVDGYDVIVKETKNNHYQLVLKGFLNEQEAKNYKTFSEFKNSLIVQL